MKYTLLKNLCLMLRKNVSISLRQQIALNVELKTLKGGKIRLGNCCNIFKNTYLSANGGNITLGNCCFINRNVTIVSCEEIKIGNNVCIAPNVVIYDHDHNIYTPDNKMVCEKIEIGNNVWIGAGAIILRGTKIKDNAVIAAGTVVKGDVDENTIVMDKREKVYKIYK